jgi:C4-dicarboxylate-specific signal transduction histidine kinase
MSRTEQNHLTERQQYWLKHIRACEAANMTTIDYAREHGLKAKSMYSARKALAENGALPAVPDSPFQKVKVASASTLPESQWRVQLPNGTAVSFGGTIDAATLTLVLNTAAAVS